jgi:hypothetical protein
MWPLLIHNDHGRNVVIGLSLESGGSMPISMRLLSCGQCVGLGASICSDSLPGSLVSLAPGAEPQLSQPPATWLLPGPLLFSYNILCVIAGGSGGAWFSWAFPDLSHNQQPAWPWASWMP